MFSRNLEVWIFEGFGRYGIVKTWHKWIIYKTWKLDWIEFNLSKKLTLQNSLVHKIPWISKSIFNKPPYLNLRDLQLFPKFENNNNNNNNNSKKLPL